MQKSPVAGLAGLRAELRAKSTGSIRTLKRFGPERGAPIGRCSTIKAVASPTCVHGISNTVLHSLVRLEHPEGASRTGHQEDRIAKFDSLGCNMGYITWVILCKIPWPDTGTNCLCEA